MTEPLLRYPTHPLARPAALFLALRTTQPNLAITELLTSWSILLLLASPDPLDFQERRFQAPKGHVINGLGIPEIIRENSPVNRSEVLILCAYLGVADCLGNPIYVTPTGFVFIFSAVPDAVLLEPTEGIMDVLISVFAGDGGSPFPLPQQPTPRGRLGGPARY